MARTRPHRDPNHLSHRKVRPTAVANANPSKVPFLSCDFVTGQYRLKGQPVDFTDLFVEDLNWDTLDLTKIVPGVGVRTINSTSSTVSFGGVVHPSLEAELLGGCVWVVDGALAVSAGGLAFISCSIPEIPDYTDDWFGAAILDNTTDLLRLGDYTTVNNASTTGAGSFRQAIYMSPDRFVGARNGQVINEVADPSAHLTRNAVAFNVGATRVAGSSATIRNLSIYTLDQYDAELLAALSRR